jgi:integrase
LLTRRKAGAVGDYVFEGVHGRLSNLRYPLEAVRKVSGITFTPHDLRRTFSTVADSRDVPAYAVKALLNHKNSADVTQGYVVVMVERLRGPMQRQRITDYILAAGGVRKGAKVVASSAADTA